MSVSPSLSSNTAPSGQPGRLRAIIQGTFAYRTLYERQKASALRLFALVLITVSLVALVTLPFRSLPAGDLLPSLLGSIFVLLSMSLTLVLISQGKLSEASTWFVVALYLGVTVTYISISEAASVILFTIPLIAAGTLIGLRGLISTSILTIVTYVGTTQFAGLGLLPGISLEYSSPLNSIPFAAAALIGDAVLLALFAAGQTAALIDQNDQLENSLKSTLRIGEAVSSAQDVDEVLQKAVESLRDDFDFDYVRAFLVESSGLPVLHARAGFARANEEVSQSLDAINGIVQSGKPLQVPVTDDPSGLRGASLLLPLTVNGQTVGVVDIESRRANAFSGPIVQVLMTLTVQVAAAVQRTRMSEDLKAAAREREQHSAQIRETSRQLKAVNQDNGSYTWRRVVRMRGQEAIGFRWQSTTGLLTPDDTLTPGLERALTLATPEVRTEGGEQLLIVPIVLRGQVLGAMEFRTSAEQGWPSRSIDLARIISQRLALALDNARLYEQARTLADREQTVNQVAARLQSRTDIDAVIVAAVESFQSALGATRANIRLGTPDHTGSSATRGNGNGAKS